MEIVTGDRYLESLVKFVEKNASGLIEGTLVLKLNPVGMHYVQSRLESLYELERLISGAPVDYLRAYVSDLGDHRALEQLRRILCRLTMLKIVSVLNSTVRDPTPVSLVAFERLKVLELRGCDLSTSPAKGLLELRHTLEKLICHNSTDALRHVFASRISDIKDSPHWNRLSFVSCACNGLVLMDDSLQLLPAIETLDLSRNKFAKADNLRKCMRLRHLDLGFNQLRTLASFSEVTCHITELVLRNNALTSLRGIETLKSMQGLDVSYNIISSFVELEVLSSLPSLADIWLEGNPVSCARWYRPQIFSYFAHPEQVKLDDKEMSTREFWKRQIIVARRQRKPASYGFYSPAREENEGEGIADGKRKKLSRLACIETEGPGVNMFFEQDSLSCENEIQGGGDDFASDNEGEVISLIHRIECMKRERSKLWLDEFKGWMDQGSENWVDSSTNNLPVVTPGRGKSTDTGNFRLAGETSRYSGYESDPITSSGDDRSVNNSSFGGSYGDNYGFKWLDSASRNQNNMSGTIQMAPEKDGLISESNSDAARIRLQGSDKIDRGVINAPAPSVSGVRELRSLSGPLKSPPHYQEDILYRRQYLEEEFFRLSAESLSVASSDSDTSSDEGNGHEGMPPSPKSDQFVGEELLDRGKASKHSSVLEAKKDNRRSVAEMGAEAWGSLDSCAKKSIEELDQRDNCSELSCDDVPPVDDNEVDVVASSKQYTEHVENNNPKRMPKKRVVSLS